MKSLKRAAWAFGCAKHGSEEEAQLRSELLSVIASEDVEGDRRAPEDECCVYPAPGGSREVEVWWCSTHNRNWSAHRNVPGRCPSAPGGGA